MQQVWIVHLYFFCCRVPPHGESLHGFLTGARYNRYLNVYTKVNTTSNGPFCIEDSFFGPKDTRLHTVPTSMSRCPCHPSVSIAFFVCIKHILLTKFALRVTKTHRDGSLQTLFYWGCCFIHTTPNVIPISITLSPLQSRRLALFSLCIKQLLARILNFQNARTRTRKSARE